MAVYERNRNLSDMEFYSNALALRVQVNKLMAKSTVVPKSYRLLNAIPTTETARSIVYNINRGYNFYPNTPANVIERRKYYTLAIADCEQLCLDFQCLLELGLPVKPEAFGEVIEMAEREIALLKGARKNVRLTGTQSVDQRITEMQEELERLRAL